MEEHWKPVKGFEGLYEVSDLGNVRSIPRQSGILRIKGRVLKQFESRNGYLCVCLSKEGCSTTIGVHRLVATAFIKKPNGKTTVNHINEDKHDNRSDNLEWLTLRENIHYGTRASRQRKSITESRGIPILQIASDGHTALAKYESLSLAAEAVAARATDILDALKQGRRCRGFFWRKLDDIRDNDLIFWKETGEKVSAPKTGENKSQKYN